LEIYLNITTQYEEELVEVINILINYMIYFEFYIFLMQLSHNMF